MNTTVNGKPQKTTAHQLWVDKLIDQLGPTLFPKSVQRGKVAFMTSKESVRLRAEKAIGQAVDFENTRLRVVVDEMISKADHAQKVINGYRDEIKGLNIWQMGKRKKIMAEVNKWIHKAEAFQEAILVLVNTPPPKAKIEDPPKPAMHINMDDETLIP